MAQNIINIGILLGETGLQSYKIIVTESEQGDFTLNFVYEDGTLTVDDIKNAANTAIGVDLSFLEPALIELLQQNGVYDGSHRQVEKMVLYRGDNPDECAYEIEATFSIMHAGRKFSYAYPCDSLQQAIRTFPAYAKLFELDDGVNKDEFYAQLASYQPNMFDGPDGTINMEFIKSTLFPPSPYIKVDHPFYKYFEDIKDVVLVFDEGGRVWTTPQVTKDTDLAILKVPSVKGDKDIWNHLHACEPQLFSRFIIGDKYLPDIDFVLQRKFTDALNMKVTFVDVAVAPHLRISLHWPTDDKTSVKCSFDFPFTGEHALVDFKLEHGLRETAYVVNITFKCNGGYLMEGHHKLLQRSHSSWKDRDQKLYDYVCGLTSSNNQEVKLELWQQLPEKKTSSRNKPVEAENEPPQVPELSPQHARLFMHFPGTPESKSDNANILKSFESEPYSAWHNNNSRITVQPGIKRNIFDQMSRNPPMPMMPFPKTNVFRTITEARLKLSEGTHYEQLFDTIALAAFCNPKHELRLYAIGDIASAAIEFGHFGKLNEPAQAMPARIPKGTQVKLTWQSEKSEHVQEAMGIVTSPPGFTPRCDMWIVIYDRETKSFGYNAALNALAKAQAQTDESHDRSADSSDVPGADGEAVKPQKMSDPKKYKGQCKVWKDLSGASSDDKFRWAGKSRPVKLEILPNRTTYNNTMNAVNILTGDPTDKWLPILLNQYPHELEHLDFTAAIEDRTLVDERYQQLQQLSIGRGNSWNAEQREAILRLRNNPGGPLLMISGPAGTGKSTFMIEVAKMFYDLGYHIIFDAPANSNVEDFVDRLQKAYPNLDFLRMTPAVSKSGLLSLVTGDTDLRPPSKDDFDDDVIYEMMLAKLEARTAKTAGSRNRQLAATVYDEAMNGTRGLSHDFQYGDKQTNPDFQSFYDRNGELYSVPQTTEEDDADDISIEGDDDDDLESDDDEDGDKVVTIPTAATLRSCEQYHPPDERKNPLPEGWIARDLDGAIWYVNGEHVQADDPRTYELWTQLRHYLAKFKVEDDTDTWSEDDASRFKICITRASQMIIAHTRFVCCTSDTAHGKAMRAQFATGNYGAAPCVGVVVFKDEAAKATEPSFWGSIVHGPWKDKVQGVIACGDWRQLSAYIGSGNTNNTTTNPCRLQMEISFMKRAVEEGFPTVEFVEQARMHEALVPTLSKHIYESKLRTANSCKKSLDICIPGIKEVIKSMLVDIGMTSDRVDALEEKHLRLQTFMVPGRIIVNNLTSSKVNMEQIHWAIGRILPAQQQQFAEKTNEHCMWISGYLECVDQVEALFTAYRYKHPELTMAHFPRVFTIDSSQGREAAWVLHIAVATDADRASVGFLRDDTRTCVARSRAKEIFHEVCGDLGKGDLVGDNKSIDLLKAKMPYLIKHHLELERSDLGVTGGKQEPIPMDQIPHYLRPDEELVSDDNDVSWGADTGADGGDGDGDGAGFDPSVQAGGDTGSDAWAQAAGDTGSGGWAEDGGEAGSAPWAPDAAGSGAFDW